MGEGFSVLASQTAQGFGFSYMDGPNSGTRLEPGLHAHLPCSLIPGPRVSTQRSTRRMLRLPMTPTGSQRGKKLNALPQLGNVGTNWVLLFGFL